MEEIIKELERLMEEANYGSKPRFDWYDEKGRYYQLGLLVKANREQQTVV